MKRIQILAAVILLLATACSAEPTSEDFAESLAEARPELGEEGVECLLEELGGSYTDAELAALIDTDSTATESEKDDFALLQFEAVRACELEGEVSPALVTAFASANGLSEEVAGCAVTRLQGQFGFWELTDQLAEESASVRFQRRQLEAIFGCGDRTEVARQLEPQLEAQGVDANQATCVADELAGTMDESDLSVLYSGETTDRFFELYFNAVETCGALPE